MQIHGVSYLINHVAFVGHHHTEELYCNWVENSGRPGALQMLNWGSCLPTEFNYSHGKADRWK